MEEVVKVTLKVRCDNETQAKLLEDLIVKITPQFKGGISIEVETTLDKIIEKQKKEWQEGRRGL